jgi:hypothetical protein
LPQCDQRKGTRDFHDPQCQQRSTFVPLNQCGDDGVAGKHLLGADSAQERRNRDEGRDGENDETTSPQISLSSISKKGSPEQAEAEDGPDDGEMIQQEVEMREVNDSPPT